MQVVDILLMIVSILLTSVVVLQKSSEDSASAFTGEKSELFSNKKERGIEVWIKWITMGLSISFFILAIIASFFITRFNI